MCTRRDNNDKDNVEDYEMVTWNAQGRMSGGRSIYDLIMDMIRNKGIEIIVIQEAGAPITGEREIEIVITNEDNVPYEVHGYIWNCGGYHEERRKEVFFYSLEVNSGNNRLNLSIVSTVQADEVIVLQGHNAAEYERPILGIRIGTSYIFNIHANAGNSGGNVPGLIKRVYEFMTERQMEYECEMEGRHTDLSWIIMGDFNREPATVESWINENINRRELSVVHQNDPTHSGGRNLDYAVVSGRSAERIQANRMSSDIYRRYSDHFPVRFSNVYGDIEEIKKKYREVFIKKKTPTPRYQPTDGEIMKEVATEIVQDIGTGVGYVASAVKKTTYYTVKTVVTVAKVAAVIAIPVGISALKFYFTGSPK